MFMDLTNWWMWDWLDGHTQRVVVPGGNQGVFLGSGLAPGLLDPSVGDTGSGIEAPSTSAKDTELCGGKGWDTQRDLGRLDLMEVKSKFPQPKLRLGGGWTESSPKENYFG